MVAITLLKAQKAHTHLQRYVFEPNLNNVGFLVNATTMFLH